VEPGTGNRGTRYENPERKMPESVTGDCKTGICKTRHRKSRNFQNPEKKKPRICETGVTLQVGNLLSLVRNFVSNIKISKNKILSLSLGKDRNRGCAKI
jgi:hypothetical protein